jgi:hypothetical protein
MSKKHKQDVDLAIFTHLYCKITDLDLIWGNEKNRAHYFLITPYLFDGLDGDVVQYGLSGSPMFEFIS